MVSLLEKQNLPIKMNKSLIYLFFLMGLGISPSMSQEDPFLRDFLTRSEQSGNYIT